MPDWKEEVQQHMAGINLPPDTKREVIAELASHFEDSANTAPATQVSDTHDVKWRRLARAICRARGERTLMSCRIKTFWLPALANLALTIGLVILFDYCNWQEPGMATPGHSSRAFRLPFLLILPLVGAVGSFLAKRAQASRRERILSGLAPSLLWLAVLLIVGLPLALDPHHFSGIPLSDFVLSAVGLVVLPALVLSLGTLPFLGNAHSEIQPSRETNA